MCNNKQTRSDVVSILIAILHDGLRSQKALEKMFSQIALKSKKGEHLSVSYSFPIGCLPNSIGVQVIEALLFLLEKIPAMRLYLLTEHENSFLTKKHLKKFRLKKASYFEDRYPINLLFRLLENPLLSEDHLFIDLLSNVLNYATRPLLMMRDKEKALPASFSTSFIPEKNLRLLVKILASNECVNSTFRSTISCMHHLSLLINTQNVFSKELSERATEFGDLIIEDLDVLTSELPKEPKAETQENKMVSKFTASSSDQAKLLRILTALDYMYESQKREHGSESSNDDELLSGLYKHLQLGKLWKALSDCLRILEDNSDLSHVATALLPLIEALMVVCKHSKVKELPIKDVMKYEVKKIDFTKEPIESLFFSFTDEHKKILNQMVRSNPNLMSGPFSMLVRNSRVLEFDNKRNYFNRQLHDEKEPSAKMGVSIRRDQVFLDSYRALFFKSVQDFKKAHLEINFKGEAGIDAGGVTREWYQVLSRQMFNPDYALFTPVASDENTYHPNRTSYINPEHLSFFKFIGRTIGKAIYDGCFLDCHFSRAVYKKILDRSVSLKDMENLDLEYFKSLMWMLENDITDIITEDFSVETDDYGEHKVIDLVPDGRNIPVDESNKHEYVRLVVEYRLQTSVNEQMQNFITGFHEIIPRDLVAIFDEQELELLISGLPDIDVQDWQNNTNYHNYSASSEQIQWFWRAVKSFDNEERAKLLQFSTGTSKVPLNGFKDLRGANGVCKFSIHRDYGAKDRLPSSHTCFNQIDLPVYESYETLRGSLLLALSEGHEGFQLA
ncbi:HECT-domain-containing protein [Metschnikowia bicuspidata var. bicuspidata NRRL YB-4993]|uniref:HECT-type E3 ubiquitin transferase n=1 Tax=Metschnikowia bicuspidata var. bicuspidata NRRL YB-4993 TaxID=869754 RepID=A0A1A0HIG6_9ASCO|nr:HECT-domain-containing protein [Metschnikowia bicuspidata var. bicuspidata NRRL YB-4993]OBA23791.1 HECT-domain-containing protein [Metschnikowia bicuspidata var. bicuspidata NRRL YB-4993]